MSGGLSPDYPFYSYGRMEGFCEKRFPTGPVRVGLRMENCPTYNSSSTPYNLQLHNRYGNILIEEVSPSQQNTQKTLTWETSYHALIKAVLYDFDTLMLRDARDHHNEHQTTVTLLPVPRLCQTWFFRFMSSKFFLQFNVCMCDFELVIDRWLAQRAVNNGKYLRKDLGVVTSESWAPEDIHSKNCLRQLIPLKGLSQHQLFRLILGQRTPNSSHCF